MMNEIIHELFVPGRLCILGEHSDWAAQHRSSIPSLSKGYALVCTTNQGIHANCHSIKPNRLIFKSSDNTGVVKTLDVDLNYEKLVSLAANDIFFGYICGTVAIMIEKYADKINSGITIDNYHTTLPMGKGLSSSAAICVLVAKAFHIVYQLDLSMEDIMEYAFLGEMMTPSRCGRMDQCVAMGANAVGLMEFDTSECSLKVIKNAKPLYFVVADLCAGKDTIVILRDLNNCFPVPENDSQKLMHEYVHLNVDIASRAVQAIETGDLTTLARMMTLAQTEFDRCAIPNCPSELTSPRLRQVMNDDRIKRYSLASKGVGSQGDGTIQILCSNQENQKKVLEIVTELGCDGFLLCLDESVS